MPPSLSDFRLPPSLRLMGEAIRTFDPRDWARENPRETLAMGLHSLRSGLFVAESLPLFLIARPASGQAMPQPPEGALEVTLARLHALLEQDAAFIGRGGAPLSVLKPRDAMGHGLRLLRILADGSLVSQRRRQGASREFSRTARRWLEDLPAYYRRNFHYQTDGYLSDTSAELYEHQVELLFRGGADAMRRMILPPLEKKFGTTRGRGLHFLELGSGTGTATQSVARCYPEAKITCLDMSPPYTQHARRQLAKLERVDCIQGDAAALDFAEARFDAVYSTFLFHELPLPVREIVLDEALRVLRPGGFFGFVDSLQHGDDPDLDWALDFFPREFHEPYYANYSANPMEGLLSEAGFEDIESGTGYLAKWISARAPSEQALRKEATHDEAPHDREA